MRKMWIAVLGLSLVAAVALRAQEHSQEKKAIDVVTISSPVMIGGQVLPAGKYEVSCDTKEVTFTRLADHEKVLTLVCKGKEMGKRAEFTEVHSDLNTAGVRVVTKLLIRGSNVEHVF